MVFNVAALNLMSSVPSTGRPLGTLRVSAPRVPINTAGTAAPGAPTGTTPRTTTTKTTGFGFVADNTVVTEWTDKSNQVGDVTFPVFGGVTYTMVGNNKVVFPWSGTDPDSSVICYSYDSTADTWFFRGDHSVDAVRRRGPEHIGMYRMPGFKNASKIQELCTTYSGTAYNGLSPKAGARPTMPLKTFKELVRRHMIVNGMWDIFSIETGGESYDLFHHHSLFLLEDVQTHVQVLLRMDDALISENLTYSGQYVRNAIDADLLQAVVDECGVNASGPVTFCALMKVLQSDSFASIEKTKDALKKVTLKSYAAEDVEACASDVEGLVERLDCAGVFTMELFCIMVKIFQGSSVEEFRLWAMEQYREYSTLARQLRVYSTRALGLPSLPKYEDFLRDAKLEYRSLRDSESGWGPLVKSGSGQPKADLPAAFKAEIRSVVESSLKRVRFDDTTKKPVDPQKTKKKDTDGTPPADDDKKKDKATRWPTAPPPANEPHKIIKLGKRRLKYCRKCTDRNGNLGRWCYHFTDKHDEWTAKRTSPEATLRPPPRSGPANPQGALAQVGDDDDFISFGGLRAAFSS